MFCLKIISFFFYIGPLDPFLLEQKDELFKILHDYHKQNCQCDFFYECIKTYRRFVSFNKMFHSLKYLKRQSNVNYFVEYTDHRTQSQFGTIECFFQYQIRTYALLQNFQVVHAFSCYLQKSRYYTLLKDSIDSIYFVLKKTNNHQIVIADTIQKHMIVFENVKKKSTVIATPVSSLVEHD